jgi:hypothetical protein
MGWTRDVVFFIEKAEDCWFEPLSEYVQTKDYEIGIYRFSTKHAALRSKSKKLVDSESA